MDDELVEQLVSRFLADYPVQPLSIVPYHSVEHIVAKVETIDGTYCAKVLGAEHTENVVRVLTRVCFREISGRAGDSDTKTLSDHFWRTDRSHPD